MEKRWPSFKGNGAKQRRIHNKPKNAWKLIGFGLTKQEHEVAWDFEWKLVIVRSRQQIKHEGLRAHDRWNLTSFIGGVGQDQPIRAWAWGPRQSKFDMTFRME